MNELNVSSQRLDRLAEELPELTPEARKAAIYMLENPLDVGVLPIREFADAAKVNPNTVVRLARQIGFTGYDEFRAPFREVARGLSLERSRFFPRARLTHLLETLHGVRLGAFQLLSQIGFAFRKRARRVFQRGREGRRVLLLRGAHGVFGLRLRVLDLFRQTLDLQTGPFRLFLVLLAHLLRPSRRLVQGFARVRQTRVVLLLARQQLSLGPVART